jgi:hypothetical protein
VRSIVKYVVVMCLLLTLWSAMAVVVHHHGNSMESAQCMVCAAAHSASPSVAVQLLHAFFLPVRIVKVQAVSAKGRLVSFALTVRPPPVA